MQSHRGIAEARRRRADGQVVARPQDFGDEIDLQLARHPGAAGQRVVIAGVLGGGAVKAHAAILDHRDAGDIVDMADRVEIAEAQHRPGPELVTGRRRRIEIGHRRQRPSAA